MNGGGVGTIIGFNPLTGMGLIRARVDEKRSRPEWVSFKIDGKSEDIESVSSALMMHIGLEVGFEYVPYWAAPSTGSAHALFVSEFYGVEMYRCIGDVDIQYRFPYLAMKSNSRLSGAMEIPWNDGAFVNILSRERPGESFVLISIDSTPATYPFIGGRFEQIQAMLSTLSLIRGVLNNTPEPSKFGDRTMRPLAGAPDDIELLLASEAMVTSFGQLRDVPASSLTEPFYRLQTEKGRLVFRSRSLTNARLLAQTVAGLFQVADL